MKNFLKLFALSFITIISTKAQTQFSEILVPFDSYDASYLGSVAFADVDDDGDQDVLITGSKNSFPSRIARLYTNDGTGFFSLVSGTPFVGVAYSSVAFADVDGDGDQDVLITGSTAGSYTARLYTNDGTGTFSLVAGTPFTGVSSGSIAFSDIDDDGDQDVLITGSNNSGQITELFTNDGSGSFSLVAGIPFDAVNSSSTAFSDVDNDGDQDVLITGYTGTVRISKLYTNDGTGTFSLVAGTPFDAVNGSSIAFSDVDNDGDQDVLITGYTGTVRISKLYTNNGAGNFSLVAGTPFDAVSGSSIAFSDVDGDGDQDILITGYTGTTGVTQLYANDGLGNYTVVSGTSFPDVYSGSIAFSDIDADGDQDVLITGYTGSTRITKVYRNNPFLTYVPDDNFENYLEAHNASGVFVGPGGLNNMGNGIANDDSVTTANINTVIQLDVTGQSIADLTGIEDFALLENLNATSNNLTTVDISNNTQLKIINFLFNDLTALDVSSNPLLTSIVTHHNNLTSLDISNNPLLTSLDCRVNNIDNLDLSNPLLGWVHCSDNEMTTLTTGSNTALATLYCHNNDIVSLDFSANTNLSLLQANNNQLTSLNVANGNNTNFTQFQAQTNSNLFCIEVDDASYSTSFWPNKDNWASYNEDCLTDVWTGNASTDWNTASNWSNNIVPSISDVVIIPDVSLASGNFPIASVDITVGDLTVMTGASLTISAGNGLILAEDGSVTNNGSLTLETDATGTAWLDDFTFTGTTYTGNITVEQFVSIGAANGQRMFGSPVNNGVVQGLDQTYASGTIGQMIVSNCASAQVDAGSPYNNLFEWNEAATLPNNCEYEAWFARLQATPLVNGRGYSGWMQSGTYFSFTGTPNTGNISYGSGNLDHTVSSPALPNKDGWHVLSNPYPSPVNISSMLVNNWTSPQMYNASQAYGGTFQPVLPSDTLAIAQGFVAQTTVDNNTFSLTNDDRIAANSQFKSNQNWFESKLNIEVAGNGFKDISYIYFNESATEAFDNQWDCVKRSSDADVPTLYTLIDGERSSLNGNATAELGEYSIPLGLDPQADATFSFTVTGIETLPATTMAYLEDKATGTWLNLRENDSYTFDMTTTENEERFEVHFTKPITLAALAESCAQDDGTLNIDFGNQILQGNSVVWEYSITLDNETVASGAASNVVELDELVAGEYEVILTNGNYETTETVLLEDKEPVEANFETAAAITEGDEVIFNNLSIGATDFVWTINGEIQNTSDASYIFELAGTYTITLEASNEDCDASYSTTIEVAEKAITISSIADSDNLNNILVYTNNNTIVVDLSNADLQGKTDVEVYDLLGQLIVAKVTQQELLNIELINKAAGFYLVHIVNNGKQTTEKVFLK